MVFPVTEGLLCGYLDDLVLRIYKLDCFLPVFDWLQKRSYEKGLLDAGTFFSGWGRDLPIIFGIGWI